MMRLLQQSGIDQGTAEMRAFIILIFGCLYWKGCFYQQDSAALVFSKPTHGVNSLRNQVWGAICQSPSSDEIQPLVATTVLLLLSFPEIPSESSCGFGYPGIQLENNVKLSLSHSLELPNVVVHPYSPM